jgi:hypothetical protein
MLFLCFLYRIVRVHTLKIFNAWPLLAKNLLGMASHFKLYQTHASKWFGLLNFVRSWPPILSHEGWTSSGPHTSFTVRNCCCESGILNIWDSQMDLCSNFYCTWKLVVLWLVRYLIEGAIAREVIFLCQLTTEMTMSASLWSFKIVSGDSRIHEN